MTSGNFNDESQRDSDIKPKVARDELPWERSSQIYNPNGVAAVRWNRDATPLGLGIFSAVTQGSSFLATLGYVTQSRWDCGNSWETRMPKAASLGCHAATLDIRL